MPFKSFFPGAVSLFAMSSLLGWASLLLFGHPSHATEPIRWESDRGEPQWSSQSQNAGEQLLERGMLQLQNAEAQEAIASFQQALDFFQERSDRAGEGQAFTHLAMAYEFLNDYPQALEYHQEALAISRALGNREWEVSDLNSLGAVHNIMGNIDRALDYSQQSLDLARDIGDRRGEGNALGSLGFASFVLGDLVTAIASFESSLAIAEELEDEQMAQTSRSGLSQAQTARTRRLEEAQTLLRNGIEQLRGQQERTAIEDSFPLALRLFQETGDRVGEGEVLAFLGYAHLELGDLPQAARFFERSLAIAREVNDSELEAFALEGLDRAQGGRQVRSIHRDPIVSTGLDR
ncbi:MAG: tetratricopeptide repeat protein [Cyanobacteriota bacterium]|nr:tetratricopeptide repeat protein [Cyanobacteriota bacterium]